MYEPYLYDNDFCYWYNNQTCEYKPDQLRFAWKAWEASRAALALKLPEVRELEFNSNDNPYSVEVCLSTGYFFDSEELLSRLQQAGVKYE